MTRTTPGVDLIPYNRTEDVVDRDQTLGLLLLELSAPAARPTSSTNSPPAESSAANSTTDTIDARTFYDEDRNPILKSFKST